jgi:hypothetical protein
MVRSILLGSVGCCAVMVASPPASAHHSRAQFDAATEIVLEGTVTAVQWANPHVYFRLDVQRPDGATVSQEVEVGPLSTLQALGLSRGVVVPGERVSIRANPNRRGAGHLVVGLDLTKSNGEVYPLHVVGRARPPPRPTPAESLAGRWVPVSEDFMRVLVQGSRSWALTDAGRAGIADGAGDSQGRCVPWPAPMVMGLPMLRTIEIDADRVTIDFDWMGAQRVVRMDLAEHPSQLEPTLQGHSIGRWEGDALIIDSRGFSTHEEGVGFGVPGGIDKRLVERLELTTDRTRLRYEFTVEDPLSLTEPTTQRMEWVHRPDLEPTGEECDRELAERFLNEG